MTKREPIEVDVIVIGRIDSEDKQVSSIEKVYIFFILFLVSFLAKIFLSYCASFFFFFFVFLVDVNYFRKLPFALPFSAIAH